MPFLSGVLISAPLFNKVSIVFNKLLRSTFCIENCIIVSISCWFNIDFLDSVTATACASTPDAGATGAGATGTCSGATGTGTGSGSTGTGFDGSVANCAGSGSTGFDGSVANCAGSAFFSSSSSSKTSSSYSSSFL